MNTLKLLSVLSSLLITSNLLAADASTNSNKDEEMDVDEPTFSQALTQPFSDPQDPVEDEAPSLSIDKVPQHLTLEQFNRLCDKPDMLFETSTRFSAYPGLEFLFSGINAHETHTVSDYNNHKDHITHFGLEIEDGQTTFPLQKDKERPYYKLFYKAALSSDCSIIFKVRCRKIDTHATSSASSSS